MKRLLNLDLSEIRSVFQFIFWVIIVLVGTVFSFTAAQYTGTFLHYALFTLAFNVLLALGFRKGFLFTELFVAAILWLGFWFKFSMIVLFKNGNFKGTPVGRFDYSPEAFDSALFVSTCGALGLILIFALRRYFFPNRNLTEMPHKPLVNLRSFYTQHRVFCRFAVVALSVGVSLVNIDFGIYQRGMPPAMELSKVVMGVVSWLLLFGTASFYTVFIDFDLASKKKPYATLSLALIDMFMTNVSMLSRGMIFNGAAVYLGALTSALKRVIKVRLKEIASFAFLFLLLFSFSIVTVNYARSHKFVMNYEPEPLIGVGMVPVVAQLACF